MAKRDPIIECMILALSDGDKEYADDVMSRGGYNGVNRTAIIRIKRALVKAGYIPKPGSVVTYG